MKTCNVLTAIALTAILFVNPVMAFNSIQSSNEKGHIDQWVWGYFGETMVPEPDVEHSVSLSRENGGSQHALNNARSGYGVGTESNIEQSRENGMRW
jgi:hypothetical protein